MNCDLCGTNGELFSAVVEGSLMEVCSKCLKFGKLIEKRKDFDVEKIVKKKITNEIIFVLKKDYNLILKNCREESKLTQEELAKKLNEKVSLIQKIENKGIEPNDELVNKYEKFFRINLREEFKQEPLNLNFKNSTLTIGDLLRFKKK